MVLWSVQTVGDNVLNLLLRQEEVNISQEDDQGYSLNEA